MKEFLALVEKYKSVSKEADEELNKRKRILTELEKAERSLKKAQEEDAVEVQKLRIQTSELNKTNKETARSALNLITPYQKFAKEVNEAKNKAKNLGAEMIDLEKRFKNGEIRAREYNKEIARLSKEFTEAKLKAMGLDTQLKKLDASVGDNQRNVGNYKSAINGIAGSFKNLIGAFGVVSAIDMFADLVRQSYETVKILNAQNTALLHVFETQAQVAYQKEFLTELTKKYGLELTSTTEAYTKFSAAAKGTYLEGKQARDIFDSFSGASARLGLSADQTAGIFKALEQMMSKGKIQAEELRGQLGDRMAGAFQLFAAAMGITTAQLDKMLKDGEVLADDVLPKVSDRLKAVGNTEGIDNIVTAQNRLKNEWTSFLDLLANDKEVINGVVKVLEFMGDVLDLALETLIIRGEDGVSVLGDLIDIIESLIDVFSVGANKARETDENFKPFIGTLMHAYNVVLSLTAVIAYLGETVSNVLYGISHLDWDGFTSKMEKSADDLLKKFDEIDKRGNEANFLMNSDKSEAEIWLHNEEEKTERYKKAWDKARKSKEAYFQFDGKYFSSTTGKNTGKSLDDYIDINGELVAKKKYGKSTIGDDGKDEEKASKKAERERKKREREAERLRKLAYQNAKSEIEARKIALDYIVKFWSEEQSTVEEKQLFYDNYYHEKLSLLEKEKNLELANAKSKGETNKIIEKYELDKLELEKQQLKTNKEIRVKAIENEKTLYEARNKSILDSAIDLTDDLVENAKKREKDITDFELKILDKQFNLNAELVKNKIDTNQELTDAETEYYSKYIDITEKGNKSILDVDRKYSEAKYNIKKLELENEKKAQGKWFDTDYAERTKYADDTYGMELQKLTDSLTNKVITQNEFDQKQIELKLNRDQEIQDIETEFWETQLGNLGEAFEKQAEMQQIAYSILDLMRLENYNRESMTTEQLNQLRLRQLESLSSFVGAMAGLFNQASGAYKAFAIMQGTIDAFTSAQKAYRNTLANPVNMLLPDGGLMKAKIAFGIALAFGLAKVAVIASQKQPKYAQGTLFAERSTTAITDEEGPELHFDKNWKLKDKGSSGGARFKHVERGDKILPAALSKKLSSADIAKFIIKPQPPTIIDKTERIDYEKLASKIAEKNAVALENQKKEFFLMDPDSGELIRIESKNGVRTVYRKEPSKSSKQTLQ